MDLDRLYLDYNATSPLSPSVIEWLKSGDVVFANPSSQHTAGKAARKSINEAKAKIYSSFNKNESDTKLLFHSGATEAFVTVAHSFSKLALRENKRLLICFSVIDHPAVTSLKDDLLGEHVEVFVLGLKDNLLYDHEKNLNLLKQKKNDHPELLILYHHLWVHNETGHISPLTELASFQLIPDLYVHVDAVQAPGKILNWRELERGDVWTFSGHKFGALKGIGFSFIKQGLPFYALMSGGGQQQGQRGGTENPPGVKSVALALEDLSKVDVESNTELKEALVQFMEKELRGMGGIVRPGTMNSNTIYFYLNSYPSDVSLALFDLSGLMLSAGSACSSGAARPGQILLQLGKDEFAKNGLRISMGFHLDKDVLNQLMSRLLPIFKRLRQS